jgi:hypothetical protein
MKEAKMTYDENGLGISELSFLAVNYPATFEVVCGMNLQDGLELARKYIEAYNLGLIEK